MSCRISCALKIFLLLLFYLLPIVKSACQPPGNLSPLEYIINGDFSLGNMGFVTQYYYSATDLTVEGNYSILNDPHEIYNQLSSCKDHTDGNGLLMAVNGHFMLDRIVWQQTINNIPSNADFYFSFWASSIHVLSPAVLEVSINGELISQPSASLSWETCKWQNYGYFWNSCTDSAAVIKIVDKNLVLNGNDFVIDDLSFKPVCSLQADAGRDKFMCYGGETTIGAPSIGGFPPLVYSWSPAVGLSDPCVLTPTVNTDHDRQYILTVTDSLGCLSSDTMQVTIVPYPYGILQTDKSVPFCACDSIILSAPDGYSYLWSTGDTLMSITIKEPGRYSVVVTQGNLCSITLDTLISVKNINPTIKIDSVGAKTGDIIRIPIRIVSDYMKECGSYSFYAKISFNKSLLRPVGNTPYGTVAGDIQTIEITGNLTDTLLGELEFQTALGDSDCAELKIEDFRWDCDVMKTNSISGRMCLTDICRDNVPRLIKDTSVLYLKQNFPNPTNSSAVIEFGLIEEARSRLVLLNSLGVEILEITNADYKPGAYRLEVNTAGLASGIYYYLLQTPSQVISQKMIIIR